MQHFQMLARFSPDVLNPSLKREKKGKLATLILSKYIL